ncbi:hypothetical protein L596_013479 [Steinernema carpocapsae]|uniref:Autophagy-related protein n=1 Tax=Steinernema carpocapsae TaxID=34508 RepID=A0A4U5P157_STECR|nr:hypothetical protein L596_013479 [Steinernema carpocapsae]
MSLPTSTTIFERKPYKERHSLEKRLAKINHARLTNASYIAVVCEKALSSKLEPLKHACFMALPDVTIGVLLVRMRSQLTLKDDESIFLFAKNAVLSTTRTISEVHAEFKDEEDDFLYLTYQEESVYGH